MESPPLATGSCRPNQGIPRTGELRANLLQGHEADVHRLFPPSDGNTPGYQQLGQRPEVGMSGELKKTLAGHVDGG